MVHLFEKRNVKTILYRLSWLQPDSPSCNKLQKQDMFLLRHLIHTLPEPLENKHKNSPNQWKINTKLIESPEIKHKQKLSLELNYHTDESYKVLSLLEALNLIEVPP